MILSASALIPYIGIYDLQINRLIDICLIVWPRKRRFMANNSETSVLMTLVFTSLETIVKKNEKRAHLCVHYDLNLIHLL